MRVWFILILPFVLTGCGLSNLDRTSFRVSQLSPHPHQYQLVPDPLKPEGAIVERFEVRDGDCTSNRNREGDLWSDCPGKDRAEVIIRDGAAYSEKGEHWYEWDILLPDGYPDIRPSGNIIFQWKTRSKNPRRKSVLSSIYFEEFGGSYRFQGTELLTREQAVGAWNNIKLHINWTKKRDGFVHVYVNNEKKVSYENAQTMPNWGDFMSPHYGIYRIDLSEYRQASGQRVVPTQIVYIRDFKRVKTVDQLSSIPSP